MMTSIIFDATSAALFGCYLWAVVTDVREREISDFVHVGIIAAAIINWAFGIVALRDLGIGALFALAWLAFGLKFGLEETISTVETENGLVEQVSYTGLMGGGDIKLFASSALFFGPVAMHHIFATAVFGGLLSLVSLYCRRLHKHGINIPIVANLAHQGLPYGIAIALGGFSALQVKAGLAVPLFGLL